MGLENIASGGGGDDFDDAVPGESVFSEYRSLMHEILERAVC